MQSRHHSWLATHMQASARRQQAGRQRQRGRERVIDKHHKAGSRQAWRDDRWRQRALQGRGADGKQRARGRTRKHRVAACTTGQVRAAMSTAPTTQDATKMAVAQGSAHVMVACRRSIACTSHSDSALELWRSVGSTVLAQRQ